MCLQSSKSAPKVGATIYVRFDGSYWYKARVLEVSATAAKIKYVEDNAVEYVIFPDPDVLSEKEYNAQFGGTMQADEDPPKPAVAAAQSFDTVKSSKKVKKMRQLSQPAPPKAVKTKVPDVPAVPKAIPQPVVGSSKTKTADKRVNVRDESCKACMSDKSHQAHTCSRGRKKPLKRKKSSGGDVTIDGKSLGGDMTVDGKSLGGDAVVEEGKSSGGDMIVDGKSSGGDMIGDGKSSGGDMIADGKSSGGDVTVDGKSSGDDMIVDGKSSGDDMIVEEYEDPPESREAPTEARAEPSKPCAEPTESMFAAFEESLAQPHRTSKQRSSGKATLPLHMELRIMWHLFLLLCVLDAHCLSMEAIALLAWWPAVMLRWAPTLCVLADNWICTAEE